MNANESQGAAQQHFPGAHFLALLAARKANKVAPRPVSRYCEDEDEDEMSQQDP